MATQRYVSTSFWDDEWIQNLDPSEKLLYLYLMTNPLTNIAGVYKLTKRRISFDTGFNIEMIDKILSRFKKDKKAYLYKEYAILPAFPQHQKWEKRSKIKLGIDSIVDSLPEHIIKYIISIGYRYPIKAYGYLPNYIDLDSDIDLDIDTDTVKPKNQKHRYGEYQHILLTDEEYKKLEDKNMLDWITKVDEGIELKGYKYKNHYLAILKWQRDEKKPDKKPLQDNTFHANIPDNPMIADLVKRTYEKKGD